MSTLDALDCSGLGSSYMQCVLPAVYVREMERELLQESADFPAVQKRTFNCRDLDGCIRKITLQEVLREYKASCATRMLFQTVLTTSRLFPCSAFVFACPGMILITFHSIHSLATYSPFFSLPVACRCAGTCPCSGLESLRGPRAISLFRPRGVYENGPGGPQLIRIEVQRGFLF